MGLTIGIVGGGLMGCLAALTFAKRGERVVLFERRDRLMAGASAGNEGKLHHGFTYGMDRTGDTRAVMHRFGTRFLPVLERLFDRRLGELVLHRRQIYALHRDTRLDEAEAEIHMSGMASLLRPNGRHVTGDGQQTVVRLDPDELAGRFSGLVTAAWDVAEPSLDCPALMQLVTQAVAESDGIDIRT
ncbi:MAG: FAD-dependent oxidoreductase, partial [Pseudomonadota bacterium]|nr:FAD-dependent oxidoreductase [Pseudomonadota bacterium]